MYSEIEQQPPTRIPSREKLVVNLEKIYTKTDHVPKNSEYQILQDYTPGKYLRTIRAASAIISTSRTALQGGRNSTNDLNNRMPIRGYADDQQPLTQRRLDSSRKVSVDNLLSHRDENFNELTARGNDEDKNTASVKPKDLVKLSSEEIITMQKKRLRELELEVRYLRRKGMMQSQGKEENADGLDLMDKAELRGAVSDLKTTVNRCEEITTSLLEKCSILDEITNYIDSNLIKANNNSDFDILGLRDRIFKLAETLKNASKNDIEYSKRSREFEKKSIELVQLNNKHSKLMDRCISLENDLAMLRGALRADKEEINTWSKNLVQEHNKLIDSQKKFNSLKKRFDAIMVETENIQFQNKLRNALSELVKENDQLLRSNFLKGREIEKLNDQLHKQKWKFRKLQVELDKINHRESLLRKEDEDTLFEKDKAAKDKDQFQNPSYFFKGNYIPKTLEFRLEYLREEYYSLLNDILEGGSSNFTKHILSTQSNEERTEAIQLVTSQYVSFRQFSEKLNIIVNELLSIMALNHVDHIMYELSNNLRIIFNAERVFLWMIEPLGGYMYTINSSKKTIKCALNVGAMGEVIKNRENFCHKEPKTNIKLLEYVSNSYEVEYVNATVLIPIKNEFNAVLGVFEISRFPCDAVSFDVEYFGQIITTFSSAFVRRAKKYTSLLHELKLKDYYFEAFMDLCACREDSTFALRASEWLMKILNFPNARFILIDNEKLVVYKIDGQSAKYAINTGVAGRVAASKRPLLIFDSISCDFHSENVDLKSALPLFAVPAIIPRKDEDQVIGIVEILLQKSAGLKESQVSLEYQDSLKCMDPALESSVLKIAKLFATAYHQVLQYRALEANIKREESS